MCDAGPPTLTEPMVQRHSTLAVHGAVEGEGETSSTARTGVSARIAGAVAGLAAVVIGLGAFTGWMITRGETADDAELAVDATGSDRAVPLEPEPVPVEAPSLGPKLTPTPVARSTPEPVVDTTPALGPAVAPLEVPPAIEAPAVVPTPLPAVEPKPPDVPPEKRTPRKATARLRLLTKHAQVRIGQRTIKMTDDGTHSIDLRVAAGRPAIGWRLTDADPWKTIRVVFGPGEQVTVFVGRDGLRIGREKVQP